MLELAWDISGKHSRVRRVTSELVSCVDVGKLGTKRLARTRAAVSVLDALHLQSKVDLAEH
jgi:hypothetical protein